MIQSIPSFFNANATHSKGDDYISLFDEGIVQVTAIHACIRRCGDRSGRWIQPFDLGGHVLIGGRG